MKGLNQSQSLIHQVQVWNILSFLHLQRFVQFVSIPYSSGLGLELWNTVSREEKEILESQSLIHQVQVWNSHYREYYWINQIGHCLNPLFIRSRFGTNHKPSSHKALESRLNPLFIRSRFGTYLVGLSTSFIFFVSQSLIHQVQVWNDFMPFVATMVNSLNPLFIRSRFGTKWIFLFCPLVLLGKSLNPLFIRSRFGTQIEFQCATKKKGLNPLFIRSRFGTNSG